MKILICLLTLFFASRADLLHENLTIVLNNPRYRIPTIIFMIISITYYTYELIRLFKDKRINYIIIIAYILMFMSIFSPYIQNSHDLVSRMHVYGAFLSCVIVFGLFCVYQYRLYIRDVILAKKTSYILFSGINLTMICIFFFGNINGLSELISLATWTIYLYTVELHNKSL